MESSKHAQQPPLHKGKQARSLKSDCRYNAFRNVSDPGQVNLCL